MRKSILLLCSASAALALSAVAAAPRLVTPQSAALTGAAKSVSPAMTRTPRANGAHPGIPMFQMSKTGQHPFNASQTEAEADWTTAMYDDFSHFQTGTDEAPDLDHPYGSQNLYEGDWTIDDSMFANPGWVGVGIYSALGAGFAR